MQCPNCQSELEHEKDGKHGGSIGAPVLPGHVFYCPDCGYEERHIKGCRRQIVNKGVLALNFQ